MTGKAIPSRAGGGVSHSIRKDRRTLKPGHEYYPGFVARLVVQDTCPVPAPIQFVRTIDLNSLLREFPPKPGNLSLQIQFPLA